MVVQGEAFRRGKRVVIRFYIGALIVAAYRFERFKLRRFGLLYGLPRNRGERLAVWRARIVHHLRTPYDPFPAHRCDACQKNIVADYDEDSFGMTSTARCPWCGASSNDYQHEFGHDEPWVSLRTF